METYSMSQRLASLPATDQWIKRTPVAVLLVLTALLAWASVGNANGIPVQIFLDHVPVKTTWDAANNGRGVAVISSNDEQVRVMAQNLPTPPSGTSYYAWLEQNNGGFLPVGSLLYQSDGTASIDQPMPGLPYSENFTWVLISLENPQAVGSKPSADVALAGRLPNVEALPLSGNQAPQLLPVTGSDTLAPQSSQPPVWPAALLITVLCVVGLIGILRLYNRQKSHAPLQIRSQDSASGQKIENRQ